MHFTVPLAMFGWIPVGLLLFLVLPVRKAILAGYLIGWLFLPQASYEVPGLPDYTRMTAVNLVMLLGVVLSDLKRLLGVRPRIWDFPMALFCFGPLPTSLSNGLGVYDGLSGVIGAVLTWGVPYIIGRIYFSNATGIRLLAIGVFVGGLVYAPFCLYEMRMAPTLHHQVYGFDSSRFVNTIRLGGYRPRVFMHSGLPLGLWMSITALTGTWLWMSGAVRHVAGVPVKWLAPGLLIVTVMCRSLGALMLLATGLGLLFAARALRSRLPLLLLFLGPTLYVTLRVGLNWYPSQVVSLAASVEEARARSLESRLYQEEVLGVKAWRRPVFGWGGYGRNRVYDEDGESAVVTDGLWIITFGIYGLVGLVSLFAVFAIPSLLVWRHLPVSAWWSPIGGPIAAMAVGSSLYICDSLMNAMPNPIYHVMIGSLMGFAITLVDRRRRSEGFAVGMCRADSTGSPWRACPSTSW